MKTAKTKDTKRMTKSEIKKMKSRTNWARLVLEDRRDKTGAKKT